MIGEELFDKIVVETNHYACQILASNVNTDELRAYFGICVITRLNILPKVINYWSSDVIKGNEAIN